MAHTKQTTKQTAAACYAERHAECQDCCSASRSSLSGTSKNRPPRLPIGLPGDLGHVSEELAYVLASLGDRSAVDAKGLDC